ncbi:MAG: hypothetical protein F4Z15_05320 [Gammaproteobacteria bacterium]|nr:hypothetical protein [Gammaproteobacteria bacterium]MYD76164.1 hypothetical protein [Gammaproteobacteria bacterium]MYJ51343.1 hypothetical protein [Gammaproteobacteria bacterium]
MINDSTVSRGPFTRLPGQSDSGRSHSLATLAAVLLATLVVSAAVYQTRAIPDRLLAEARQKLEQAPRLSPLAVVEGRDLLLIGEIEPFPGMDEIIGNLSRIRGIRSTTDLLTRIRRPTPHLELKRNEDAVVAIGRLNGKDLASAMVQIRNAFPDRSITNRIGIDDNLGSPLWLDGLSDSLKVLEPVSNLEFKGWRGRIQLNGTVSDNRGRRLVHTMAASMMHRLEIDSRLVMETAADRPLLALTANWRGLEFSGTVAHAKAADRVRQAIEAVFGPAHSRIDIEFDSARQDEGNLAVLLSLLPELTAVRNLRLVSAGEGYVMWGEVESPYRLERIVRRIDDLGLALALDNNIEVSQGGTPATVSLFRYHDLVTISGRLPNAFHREQVLGAVRQTTGVRIVEEALDAQPDIVQSRWIDVWPEVLRAVPLDVFGISINGYEVLLTGVAATEDEGLGIQMRLADLLTDHEIRNWMTEPSP